MQKVILSDFSKTLTASTNPSTWSVIVKSGLLGEDYIKERNGFYDEYYKYEVARNIPMTKIWWKHHLDLFVKYRLPIETVERVIKDDNYFKPREGLKDFLKYTFENNIRFSISSSGITNYIEMFLEYHDCYYSNIEICSNKLIFDSEGKVSSYDEEYIMTPVNKFQHSFKFRENDEIILLGDDENDLIMFGGKCLKIGFNETVPGFDINLGKEGNLVDVIKYL